MAEGGTAPVVPLPAVVLHHHHRPVSAERSPDAIVAEAEERVYRRVPEARGLQVARQEMEGLVSPQEVYSTGSSLSVVCRSGAFTLARGCINGPGQRAWAPGERSSTSTPHTQLP